MPRRRNASARLAADAVELSIAAPQVVAARVARMAAAGATPSASDRAELARMGTEKVAALQASCFAMWTEAWRSQAALTQAWMAAMTFPFAPQRQRKAVSATVDATTRVLSAGLTPVRAKAVANAKRLSRPKKKR
jgi:hypothetical protein